MGSLKKTTGRKRQTVCRVSKLIPASSDLVGMILVFEASCNTEEEHLRSAEAEPKRRTMKACLLELRRQPRAATKTGTTRGKTRAQLAAVVPAGAGAGAAFGAT